MRSNLYSLLFINLRVTTNQKCVIDTHMKERNSNITLKTVFKSQRKRAKK